MFFLGGNPMEVEPCSNVVEQRRGFLTSHRTMSSHAAFTVGSCRNISGVKFQHRYLDKAIEVNIEASFGG
jgi:hypothetical protein